LPWSDDARTGAKSNSVIFHHAVLPAFFGDSPFENCPAPDKLMQDAAFCCNQHGAIVRPTMHAENRQPGEIEQHLRVLVTGGVKKGIRQLEVA